MGKDVAKNMNNRSAILNCSGYSPKSMCFVFGSYHEVNGTHWITDRDGRGYIIDFATLKKVSA